MSLATMHCGNCGAALTAVPDVQFVTCRHCGAALQVKRTESLLYTEKISRTLDRVSEHLDELAVEKELDRIDREWAEEREQYLVTHHRADEHENREVPTQAGSIVAAVALVVFGIIWIGITTSMSSPLPVAPSLAPFVDASPRFSLFSYFPLIGIVFVVFGIIMAAISFKKAGQYQTAHQRYVERRQAVERKLDA